MQTQHAQYVDQVGGRIPDMRINTRLIQRRLRIEYQNSVLFNFGLFTFVFYISNLFPSYGEKLLLAKACYTEPLSHKDKLVCPQSCFCFCVPASLRDFRAPLTEYMTVFVF